MLWSKLLILVSQMLICVYGNGNIGDNNGHDINNDNAFKNNLCQVEVFLVTGVNMEGHLASVCCNKERMDRMFENVSGFVIM